MPSTIAPVTAKALQLPAKQRIGLAASLLDSLEGDSGVEKKLLRELTRRTGELRRGKVKGLTTQEAYGFAL